MPTTYYLISDLHIGGDGGLARCEFESELIEFLAEIAAGPKPAELIIVGDAFGFWELTDREGASKLETHRRAASRAVPPASRDRRAGDDHAPARQPRLRPGLRAGVPDRARRDTTSASSPWCTSPGTIAGHTVWIEHGNQYDDFNRFPDFGNRYGLPLGYFITRGVVAAAGRSAERAKAKWLDDVQSVYPNEDIPFWVLSNHFYKEMTPLLRWGLFPFLLLFTASAVYSASGRSSGSSGGTRASSTSTCSRSWASPVGSSTWCSS